ncbi:iron ABC transporter permease [uncultured Alsobacter sp.]|uniref:ABC transporter permease n=1 Tax=uncultured Alsobacter sp. TaxID=1748258 RepID=UPI0025E19CAC|nr:iron ABC transporter permease [uncultured Alsobacter sp.]
MTWAALLVALLSLVPLGFVAWAAIHAGGPVVVATLLRPRVLELLVNTLLLEALTLPPAIALALATAWLTERTDLPAAPAWAWLAVAPLAVPAFVQSYAWNTLAPGFHGLWAAVAVSVLSYYPFLYMPIAAQLRRLDPALEDVAASLGNGPWRRFHRVVLPQLRLGIGAGSILVALHLLSEYGLYAMIRFDTFTTAIMDQFQSSYGGPAADMMSAVLVVMCLALLFGDGLLRRNERYARLGPGSARVAPRVRLGAWRWPSIAFLVLCAALVLGVPAVIMGRWIVAGGTEIWRPELVSAFWQTVALSTAGAAATTVAAFPMAWLCVRRPGWAQRVLEACHLYVSSLPGVVVGLALVAVTVRVAQPLYQTAATVMVAYVLLFLSRALAGLRPSLAQAPVELERAAQALGRSPMRATLEVTLRLAAPGVAASFGLVALGTATELTATLMLAPNGTRTLATAFWSLTSELDYAAAAPYAAVMVIATLPLTLILHAQSRRMSGR